MKYNHFEMLPEQAFKPIGKKMTLEGGGSGGGTSTSVQNIPDELKPLATRYTTEAINLADAPYAGFEGQRYADLTAPQTAGIGMTINRALGGSDTVNNAEAGLNQMIAGGTNPYLDSMFNQAADQVQGRVNSQFNGPGAFGGTANQEVMQRGLGDLATQMYGGAYENDQARRMQAIGMAPTFGNLAYQDAAQMMKAGQTLQDQSQNNLDWSYQQYVDEQNDPYKKLAAMSGVFGTNLGGSTTTTQPSGGK